MTEYSSLLYERKTGKVSVNIDRKQHLVTEHSSDTLSPRIKETLSDGTFKSII